MDEPRGHAGPSGYSDRSHPGADGACRAARRRLPPESALASCVMRGAALWVVLASCSCWACGGGTSATGGATGGGGGSGSDGGGGATACGPGLTCDAKSVCIVDEKAAACSAKLDDAGACPPGQTESQCGGIGYPCCCEPAPPSDYRCVDASACGAKPDCACLGAVCKNGQMCMGIGGKDREFHCSDPPVP